MVEMDTAAAQVVVVDDGDNKVPLRSFGDKEVHGTNMDVCKMFAIKSELGPVKYYELIKDRSFKELIH